jgi:hypothetical protein
MLIEEITESFVQVLVETKELLFANIAAQVDLDEAELLPTPQHVVLLKMSKLQTL